MCANTSALLLYGFCTKDLQSGLLVLTLRVENKTPSYRILMQVRLCVQDDLCCTYFLIDCLLQLHTMKKGSIHHPPVMSFYMQTPFAVRASQMGCL